MNLSDAHYAADKLTLLKSMFLVEIQKDWGDETGTWLAGTWSREELDRLHSTLMCFAECIGGVEKLQDCTGRVSVFREDLGRHGGEANVHRVSFSIKQTFSAWTVVHEFAHAWDANKGWKLSRALEPYTGGHTSRVTGILTRLIGKPDSGVFNPEDKPGRRGRKPGCNAAGYFYGDKPSGSNWMFTTGSRISPNRSPCMSAGNGGEGVALGPVPASFTLAEEQTRPDDDDLRWLGGTLPNGTYLPVGDCGPNPLRAFSAENNGLVKVVAQYTRGAQTFTAEAQLAVTVPDFIGRIR